MIEAVNDDTPFKVAVFIFGAFLWIAVFIFGAIGWLLALSRSVFKDKNR